MLMAGVRGEGISGGDRCGRQDGRGGTVEVVRCVGG